VSTPRTTENPQAFALFLRAQNYARRLTRQDLEFALQMFSSALTLDPRFALASAAVASVCARLYYNFERDATLLERARAAADRASSLHPNLPEVQVAQGWVHYATGGYEEAVRRVRKAVEIDPRCEGAYYLLGSSLFAAGRYDEAAATVEPALAASGDDYNVYIPLLNSLGALGRADLQAAVRVRMIRALQQHLERTPGDARARMHLALQLANEGRIDASLREVRLAMSLRAGEATVLYNAACVFCLLRRREDALDALRRSRDAGFQEADWARRDPDLAFLHGDPEFDRLYPGDPPERLAPPAA